MEMKYLSKLQTRIDSVENNLVEGSKSTTEKQKELLQELLEDYDHKIREVDKKFQCQKEKMMKKEEVKCEECGETFAKKYDLRNHIKCLHPKNISCDIFDSIFHKSWEYETHLESHAKPKDNKCDICGKAFFLEWRLKQHMNVHMNPQVRNCHYFNNNKMCPFDDIGCKFKHVDSKQCKNPTSCKTKLCPLKHVVV